MGFCLLLLSVALVFAGFFLHSSRNDLYTNARESFIYSLIANAVLVFVYNESASAFNQVNAKTALIFWLITVTCISALLFFWNKTGAIRFSKLASLKKTVRLSGLKTVNKVVIVSALLFYILPLLFLAVYAAPNNFDSHMYHLNRVLFWINNGNLDHFPTLHLQQLYLNVFAEYLVLDTILLSGSDQFAGLIQFGSFIGSLAGVSLLAKRLGLKQEGQLLTAIFLLTLPISIFESTSTQVDYCACFFFISYVYLGFQLLEKRSVLTLVMFLLSLSFGGFSKYTIFIFAIPFTVFFAIRILVQYRISYALKVLGLAIVLLTGTFAPFFYRNYTLFGHIMSPLRNTVFASEELPANKHSALFTFSTLIKNAGLNLGLPDTRFNRIVDGQIRSLHEAMGVEIDDPDISLDPFSVKYSVHEDMIPNTIHFWLILVASFVMLFAVRQWSIKWFWICSAMGFIVFCTLMKFQLWSTRTQMPFFAMGAVMISYIYCRKIQWSFAWLAAPLMLLSVPFVYGNPSKELVSINYLTRKLLGHIPIAICENGGTQRQIYEKYLGAYYTFPGEDGCHPLKKWPDYSERTKVFALLTKVGYYDQDRSSNILSMGRDRAYFLSHPNNYLSFKPLLGHIEGDHKNVGIFFKHNNGFYHYWSAIAATVKNPGRMEYIRYNQELMVLKNAQNDFCYDYILSDDPELLAAFVPKANIDTVYTTQLLQLMKLKKASCDKSLF
ncbi:ArnT family glycosyltransferase [Dyadobacter pollutisoli]|uniref:Glycosyltransferase family 39 protein n=1 Tax=Dyadobacter pollutisoli TaxID=2910158 RepID=A0A9E8NAD4_9BACT|nr:glycosyltransferase family 39 protein [Dyadobacter pollutisoli]WAC11406.1 glycosyltransferase family 39 protein [Dyadobacter pollutisoli]